MPSLFFLSQATKGSAVARAVFFVCVHFSAFLISFAAGWVIAYRLLMKRTVFFRSKILFKPSEPLPDISKLTDGMHSGVKTFDVEESDEECHGLAGLKLFSRSHAAVIKGPEGALDPDSLSNLDRTESSGSIPTKTSQEIPTISGGSGSSCGLELQASNSAHAPPCQMQGLSRGEEEVDLPECLRFCGSLVGDPSPHGRCNPSAETASDPGSSERPNGPSGSKNSGKAQPVAEGAEGQGGMPDFEESESDEAESLGDTNISSVEVEVRSEAGLKQLPPLVRASILLFVARGTLHGQPDKALPHKSDAESKSTEAR